MKRFLRAAILTLLGSASLAAGLTPTERHAAERLVRAYPAFLSRVEGNALVWKDGTRMPLRRARAATYPARLDRPGLLDQLGTVYPACGPLRVPARNEDPGRARYAPLFLKMYGSTAGQVATHLDTVNWFGQRLQVTRVNGAAASLRAVAAELGRQPGLPRYARPSAGTFLWRSVAGTSRPSLHAFGAAIDLNTRFSHYWRWEGYREGQAGIVYRNELPLALVRVFERHGWIWGGRWYHHDTMHFEYRPELTGPEACAHSPRHDKPPT